MRTLAVRGVVMEDGMLRIEVRCDLPPGAVQGTLAIPLPEATEAAREENALDSENEAVVSQIMRAVGKTVKFQYPGDEGTKTGRLVERAVLPSPGYTGVPDWDVVDLIEFAGEHESKWMRIGYYRKKDRLIWGSQTTITEPITIWKKLLVHAARKMAWFKQLLEEVMAEVNGRPPDDQSGL